MEFGSAGGSSGGGGGDHPDGSDSNQRRKRYHRHTAHQIQRLESMFKECPHPDEKTRNQLSRELGLHSRQIKFWFQNRRTQMKTQHERADNSSLRAENDKIRCENIVIREALKNVICPSCGGPPVTEDSYFDEQKLRMENSHLKEELDRLSSIAAKYIGRPISQLPPVHMSSLDLSMASFGGHGFNPGPSLDLDLLPGNSSSVIPILPFASVGISDMDKSVMADLAANALDEMIRLLQTNDPLWIKSPIDGREILNLESYERISPRISNSYLKNPNIRIEASRDTGVVITNGFKLVDIFMDANKWRELFSPIVSEARNIEVISSSQSGTLQLMYGEFQVLSALVPIRQIFFLRFCQQIEQGLWAIVDISTDLLHQESQLTPSNKVTRLPSGCLIQGMPNGYFKITWLEHWAVDDKSPTHPLYRDLLHSGLAFGSERWISTLQRICERFACLMVTGNSPHDIGDAVILTPEGKRSMMKLSQRMVNNFCSSFNPSDGNENWSTTLELNEFEVRATHHKSTDPSHANGVLLAAAATIWLPISPQIVFNFLRDERTRPQWDVLSNQNPVQEIAHIASGSHPGNSISVLRAFNTSQNNMLILQESCIDSSGSLVVYSPVDLPSINLAMSGEDPSYIPLVPSGFAISPDGRPDHHHAAKGGGGSGSGGDGASSSSNPRSSGGGSLLTVMIQILASSFPAARMSQESVTTVNTLIGNTIHQIKAALNCNTNS